jgi:hypothetical protein
MVGPARLSGVGAMLAAVVLSGCSNDVAVPPELPYFQALPVAVKPGDVFPLNTAYSGWWNTPAFAPGTPGLPLRVGLVRADTGELLAGYDRSAGRQLAGADRKPLPGWPAGAILAVDLATGAVWDWFAVDGDGLPARGFQDKVTAEQGFPPIAGTLAPGTFHMFLRDENTGEVIYLGTAPEEPPENAHIELDW